MVLLYSDEAHFARTYLMNRGLSVDFVKNFSIGYCPPGPVSLLHKYLVGCGFNNEEMVETGLLKENMRDFFSARVTFPILDHTGSPIGFSARKIDEATYGGKYINTQETILFKKSHILFGLSYSKKRIVKHRTLILVEGQ